MTYNISVKESLLSKPQNKCCIKTELFAYLCFGKSYFDGNISIIESNKKIFFYIKDELDAILGKNINYSKYLRYYELTLDNNDSNYIIGKLSDTENALLEKRGAFKKKCCLRAFARGLFISKGIIINPQTRYSLEFIIENDYLANLCIDFLNYIGFNPGISKRSSSNVIYIKNKEGIKDFLYYIGAVNFMFDYTNTEIKKDLQNNINRIINCENANIDKAVNSLTQQRIKIKKLKDAGYKNMSDELIDIAEKRLSSESINLDAFRKEFDPPYSKSTIYRKLKNICDLSDKLDDTGVIK